MLARLASDGEAEMPSNDGLLLYMAFVLAVQVELGHSDVQEPVPRADPDVVDDELDGRVPGQVVGEADDVVRPKVAFEDLAGLVTERQLEALLVLVDDGHVGAGHDQPLGDRLADAAGRSGHHGTAISQVLREQQGGRAGVGVPTLRVPRAARLGPLVFDRVHRHRC